MEDTEPQQRLSTVLRAWMQAERGGDESDIDKFYSDLVGLTEIAELLGVPRKRVQRWIERRESTGCPDPVRELQMGNVYSMTSWRGWHRLWVLTRGAESWRVNRRDD